MSTRFYVGQKDYITQLNAMDDAINAAGSSTSPSFINTTVQKYLYTGNGAGDTGVVAKSAASGGGVQFLAQSSNGSIIGIGNKSAFFGGTYDATPCLYAASIVSISQGVNVNGNVVIGSTPSGWNTSFNVLEVPAGYFSGISTSELEIGQNCPYLASVGNWAYKTNAPATQYRQSGGTHWWFNAPSGTAGSSVSLIQVMNLDGSGNLNLNGGAFLSNRMGASAITATLTNGAGDPSFKLVVRNGSGVAVGSEQARIGLEYNGDGNAVCGISFLRGMASVDGSINFYTNNNIRGGFSSSGDLTPGGDNRQNFGIASLRWASIYAATGAINTSDAREKTPVSKLSDNEIAAAKDKVDPQSQTRV